MPQRQGIPHEIRQCRNEMARLLNRSDLYVTLQPLDPPYQRYCFASPDNSPAEAGNRVYSVIPFYETDTEMFWIGMSVDIEMARSVSLRAVSIVIFNGNASDITKIPEFRAEWDYNSIHQNRHAQPHWQIFSIFRGSIQEFRKVFDAEPKIKDFKSKTVVEDKQFHFAMSAQWHDSLNSNSCNLDFDNVCLWFEGCINYIRSQFNYLYAS